MNDKGTDPHNLIIAFVVYQDSLTSIVSCSFMNLANSVSLGGNSFSIGSNSVSIGGYSVGL